MTYLPDRLSDIIDLAVNDCQVIEKTPGYNLYMGSWHTVCHGVCQVCMAGAVMANTLKCNKDESIDPAETGFRLKLNAIDDVRLGYIYSALENIGQISLNKEQDLEVERLENYIKDLMCDEVNDSQGRCEWEVYREVAERLRAVGL